MADSGNMNVFDFQIININLFKYKDYLMGKKAENELSLLPQYVDLVIYQSVFQPSLRATLSIYDSIGLLSHYPLMGEEVIEFTFRGTGVDERQRRMRTLTFMVSAVTDVIPDPKGRASTYVLELHSFEMYQNARRRVMRAFRSEYHEMIKTILRNDLGIDTDEKVANEKKIRDENFEETMGIMHVVVPNMKPFAAIQWMTQRAIPKGTDDKVLFFWESLDGYNLRSYENIMRKPHEHKFIYISDMVAPLRETILKREGLADRQVVNAMKINKRFNTIERIMGGYYESEFLDIDLFNRKIVSSPNLLDPKLRNSAIGFPLNTPQFIQAMQNGNETPGQYNRSRFVLSQDEGDEAGSSNNWKMKFSDGIRLLTAMNQTSLTITLAGDSRVKAGDKLKLMIPELTGYTDVGEDRYISGDYLVTDIKHVFMVGGNHAMSINLMRSHYASEIKQRMDYKFGSK